MNNALVSVILPVFNGERFISEAIDSVLQQTYPNLELLIINDASTDDTSKIISEYGVQQKVICFDLKSNTGVANARNVGLKESHGKYVAFIDADDIWNKDKLEIQIKQMIQQNLDYSYAYYNIVDENLNHLKSVTQMPDYVTYRLLLRTNYIPMLTVVAKRDLFLNDKFSPVGHEDYALWLKLFRNNNINAGACRKVLAKYRVHNHSISGNKLRSALWVWRLYRTQEQMTLLVASKSLISYIWYGLKKHRY